MTHDGPWQPYLCLTEFDNCSLQGISWRDACLVACALCCQQFLCPKKLTHTGACLVLILVLKRPHAAQCVVVQLYRPCHNGDPPAAVQGPPPVGGPGPLGSAGGSIAVADLRSSSSNSPADIARMRVQLVRLNLILLPFLITPCAPGHLQSYY